MLSILDRCLLKELLSNMVFTLVVIISIFFTVGAVQLLHKYPGIDPLLLLQALPFYLLSVMQFMLPLSLLIGVVMVFGRMASNNEITAIKAAGIHPYRALGAAVWIALVVSAATFYVDNQVSPRAEVMFRKQMQSRDNLRRLFESSIANEDRLFSQGGLTIRWNSERFPDEGGLELLGVHIVQSEKARKKDAGAAVEETVMRAERLLLRFDSDSNRVELEPWNTTVQSGPQQGLETSGPAPILTVSLGAEVYSRRLRFRTGTELVSGYLRARHGLHPEYSAEEILGWLNERAALATASLFFVLIGAPLAMVFQAGSRLVAFLLSFLVVLFVFYPAHLAAKTLTAHQILPPVLAAWSGNLLLAVLGVGLLTFVVRR